MPSTALICSRVTCVSITDWNSLWKANKPRLNAAHILTHLAVSSVPLTFSVPRLLALSSSPHQSIRVSPAMCSQGLNAAGSDRKGPRGA